MCSMPAAYQSGGAAIALFLLVLPDIRRFHGGQGALLCPSPPSRSRFLGKPMRSLDDFAGEKLSVLEQVRLRRQPVVTERSGIWAERGGRRMLSFSCNDYLNLSQHPAVIAAAVEATQRFGVGAGASRLVTGNHPLYAEL